MSPSATYNLAQEDNIFSANKKEAMPVLCKCVPVVNALHSVFENEISWERVNGLSTREMNRIEFSPNWS